MYATFLKNHTKTIAMKCDVQGAVAVSILAHSILSKFPPDNGCTKQPLQNHLKGQVGEQTAVINGFILKSF